MDINSFKNETPVFKIEEYFVGNLKAYGVFRSRSGEIKKRFTVDMVGTLNNGSVVLDETFKYSDGTSDKRIWTLTKKSDGNYIGTAGDVVGEAEVKSAGNAVNLKYTLALKVDDSVYNVKMDDWMYLIDEKVLINRTSMSKFGFNLGEVVLTIIKE